MTLYEIATRALPAEALCGIDERDCVSADRIARAVEASGYGSAAAHRTAILRAIGEHLRAYDDAGEALRWLARLDQRLATWGACACAREVLRYVRDGEERPLRAIETTERWIAGQTTLDDVQLARTVAWRACRDSSSADAAAYVSAAYAASDTTTYSFGAAAVYAANGAAYAVNDRRSAPAWAAAHTAELRRLVAVIADALPGLPEETT